MDIHDGIKIDLNRRRHTITRGNVRVSLDIRDVGEREDRDPFYRIGVETKLGNAWEWITGASVCTHIPSEAPIASVKTAILIIMDTVYDPLQFGDDIRKFARILSKLDDHTDRQIKVSDEAKECWEHDKQLRRSLLNIDRL
jgi:hypothetical protein